MTEFHALNTPDKGAADWHIPLNENFKKIDKKIEIRDEAATRSDYPPKPGAKFIATDTEAQFIGDGETWNRLASTGKDPSVSSSTIEAEDGSRLRREFLGEKPQSEDDFHAKFDASFDWMKVRLRVVDTNRNSKPIYLAFDEHPRNTEDRAVIAEGENISGLMEVLVSTEGNSGDDMPTVALSSGAVVNGTSDLTIEQTPTSPDNVQIGTSNLSERFLTGVIDGIGLRYD